MIRRALSIRHCESRGWQAYRVLAEAVFEKVEATPLDVTARTR
jgi:hypothetical protein